MAALIDCRLPFLAGSDSDSSDGGDTGDGGGDHDGCSAGGVTAAAVGCAAEMLRGVSVERSPRMCGGVVGLAKQKSIGSATT